MAPSGPNGICPHRYQLRCPSLCLVFGCPSMQPTMETVLFFSTWPAGFLWYCCDTLISKEWFSSSEDMLSFVECSWLLVGLARRQARSILHPTNCLQGPREPVRNWSYLPFLTFPLNTYSSLRGWERLAWMHKEHPPKSFVYTTCLSISFLLAQSGAKTNPEWGRICWSTGVSKTEYCITLKLRRESWEHRE